MAQATTEVVGPPPAGPRPRRFPWRWVLIAAGVAAAGVAAWLLVPVATTALTTISTDDAYVSGHVTVVAPRVAGQVVRVYVEDTARVRQGDLLVELDKQPYQVRYNLKAAAVQQARADVTAAEAQARGIEATARARRWQLQTAIEQVRNQIAVLNARVADLASEQAVLDRARADLRRAEQLRKSGAISPEELDVRREAARVAEAATHAAEAQVYQARAALGLPGKPPRGTPLDHVPPDLEQNFSGVRVALANLVQSAATLGLPLAGTNETPQHYLDQFIKLDGEGALDKLLARLVQTAPGVQQAEAKLKQAEQDLEQARLDLSYCEVRAEIDGVVSRRNVNPGNNVTAGQQLMAVRSFTEIWVEANFKETQLAGLRIGQPADLYIDMYGDRRVLKGRVAGFAPATGASMALLPPENATGNFVKVVQRLPVRIELTESPPEDEPLFAGLSVTPYVHYREPPTGPNAGQRLQAPIPPPSAAPPARPPGPAAPVAQPASPPRVGSTGGRP